MTLLVGAACYFTQASELGRSVVQQADHTDNGITRQIFWAKYVNWVVSFPSLALGLGLLSGVSWTTIVLNIFISWFWVLTYLSAAYTTTVYKWGFFTFGTFSWVILAMSTLNESRESAAVLGIERDYMILSVWTNILWALYPIAFGLSDGGNIIGVTGGFIFFGVLDVLMMPLFTFLFLVLSRTWDWENLNLNFSEYRGVRTQREDRTLNKDIAQGTRGDPSCA
jgi:bacteriorhodopsin